MTVARDCGLALAGATTTVVRKSDGNPKGNSPPPSPTRTHVAVGRRDVDPSAILQQHTRAAAAATTLVASLISY